MPNNTKMSQKDRDAETLRTLEKIPASKLTQSQKAQLAAARVRDKEEPKPKPKAPKDSAPMPKMVKPQTPADVEQEKKMRRGEAAAKEQMGTLGFKKGGMVSPRGQGKVMRSRKTRMC